MANRYWVGGTASWDATAGTKWSTTSGGAGGSAVPTAADDVYFDAVSSANTITIPTATSVSCRSLNFVDGTGGAFAGTFAHASTSANIAIGDGTAGAGNVALKLASGMTYTLTGIGAITLQSTSATQQTVTCAGKTLPNVTVSGAGSSYLQSDGLTSSGTFNLAAGTWDTGSFNNQAANLNITGAGTKVFTLGSTTFTTTGTNTPISCVSTGLTLNAGTSTITFNALVNSAVWGSPTNVWYNVTASGAGNPITNTLSCTNFTRTGTALKTDALSLAGNITCTGTFTCNGNSTTNRVLVQSTAIGTSKTITAATVTVTNSDFSDITGAGAGSWNLSSISGGSGDCLGNSGITFTTGVDRYAVVAGNADSTAVWSTTNGGSGGASVPLPQDDIYFTSSSATGNYVMNMPRCGKNIDCTGFTRALQPSTQVWNTYGNVTLGSGGTYTNVSSGTWQVNGRGTHTFTSNGASLAGASGTPSLTFAGFGGTYTLQDAITHTTGNISHTAGTFSTGNFSVTCLRFLVTSGNTRTTNLGTSVVTLTSTAAANIFDATTTTGLTFNGSTATFTISNTSASTRTWVGGGQSFGTFNYIVAGSTGQLTITGANSFDTFSFRDSTNARTVLFPASVVTRIRVFDVYGTSGKNMTVKSATAGTSSSLHLIGAVNTNNDYLTVQDITSVIPYKFYAGANSTNTSNNTNIVFTAAVTQPYINQSATSGVVTSTSATTATLPLSVTAGSLIVLHFGSVSDPGTITATGYTLAKQSNNSTSVYDFIYYKVASGSETNASISWTNSRTTQLVIEEITGWSGTPTLDVTDSNTAAAGLTVSTGAGATNTTAPAVAVASVAGNGGLGASTAIPTNSFQEDFNTVLGTNSNPKVAFKPLTSTGSQTTTFAWNTSRVSASALAVFRDVASSGQELTLMMVGVGA